MSEDLRHLDGMDIGTAGASLGFWEGLAEGASQSFDQQFVVDSTFGLESELNNALERSYVRAQSATGGDIFSSIPENIRTGSIAQLYERTGETSLIQPVVDFFAKDAVEKARVASLAEFNTFNEQLKKAKLIDPRVQDFDEIYAELIAQRQEITQRGARLDATSGAGGTIGGFVGGVAGSLTTRDPLLLGTSFIGFGGSTIARRIGFEMLLGGAVEGAQQYTSVQPRREALGEETGGVLEAVLFAAVGAGIIRGGIEGAVSLKQKLGSKPLEQLASLNDTQLRQMFERMPDTPDTRAAIYALDDAIATRELNPYGDTAEGQLRFSEELERTRAAINGTETAIARFLPEEKYTYEIVEADRVILQKEQPQLFERVDELERQLGLADEAVELQKQGLSQINSETVVRDLDEVTGDLVEDLAAQRDRPNTSTRDKELLDQRIEGILDGFDQPTLFQAVIDKLDTATRDLKGARKSRKQVKTEYNNALDQINKALLAKRVEAKAIANLENVQTFQLLEPTTQIRTVARDTAPVMGGMEGVRTAVDEAAEQVDVQASAVVAREVTENNSYDIGLDEPIAGDFKVDLEIDGKMETVSVKNVMDDLKKDTDLDEAMKVCSI